MAAGDFIFEGYRFDKASGVLSLNYAYAQSETFEEQIVFAPPFKVYNEVAADNLFRLIFWLAGISYYKARVPEHLQAQNIDAESIKFLTRVYELGLAEFAHQNGLNLRGKIKFHGAGQVPVATYLKKTGRVLVPVGGGKDSIVTIESLKAAGFDVTLFALGGLSGAAQPIADTIAVSGLPHVFVSRTLAPSLMDLNKAGAYNGHVPITAILSAIALASCVLYGFDGVIMSNEHSASAPNFDDVNHQYSKSLEFERDLAQYVATHVSPDLQYFSLLRPLSELSIAKRFSAHEKYHSVFRSCNTAFRQDAASRGKKWCCACPKCRFVFLALAPFMSKKKLVSIFGENLLNDQAQLHGFSALCGVGAYKPFECVGEISESMAAICALSTQPEWQNDVVVKELISKVGHFELADFMALHPEHLVPPHYLKVLS